VRKRALLQLGRLAARIAAGRKLKVWWQRTQDNAAVACARKLTAQLEKSVRAVQGRSLSLVSGAGHDAVVLSQLTDVAMLFVRCRDGLSHHPDEYASPRDLGVALRVMVDFLEMMGEGPAPSGPRAFNIRRGRHGGRPSP
jgi:allantoate deiminase